MKYLGRVAMAQMPSQVSHDNHFSPRQTRTASGLWQYIYLYGNMEIHTCEYLYLYVNMTSGPVCVPAKIQIRVVKERLQTGFGHFDSAAAAADAAVVFVAAVKILTRNLNC